LSFFTPLTALFFFFLLISPSEKQQKKKDCLCIVEAADENGTEWEMGDGKERREKERKKRERNRLYIRVLELVHTLFKTTTKGVEEEKEELR